MQITEIGDEFLRKFECRYATEKLLDRLVFWSGPCLLLFALLSDQRGLCCFWAKAQTRLSLHRSDGIKFNICDMSSVIVVIGSLLL